MTQCRGFAKSPYRSEVSLAHAGIVLRQPDGTAQTLDAYARQIRYAHGGKSALAESANPVFLNIAPLQQQAPAVGARA